MAKFKNLLTKNILNAIEKYYGITELRLRKSKPLVIAFCNKKIELDYIVESADVDFAIAVATKNSVYALGECIANGYIVYDGGVRVGVCGEAILDKGQVSGIKNITSLVIRIPCAVEGCADRLTNIISNYSNTLLISPPSCGKTTLLRDMVRQLSNSGKEVLLIDERNELSATVEGKHMLEVGCHTDVVVGMPKLKCYESAVRCMNPEIIATDEIFGISEVDCLIDCARCGVNFLATVHSDSIDKVIENSIYNKLNLIVDNYVLLGNKPIGKMVEVRSNCLN